MGTPLKNAAVGLVLAGAGISLAAAAAERNQGQGLADQLWVDRGALTAAERRRHPAWCDGTYRLPAPSPGLPARWDDLPVEVEADQASYARDGWVEFEGDVAITQGGRVVSAERAKVHQDTREAVLEQAVNIRDADVLMQGVAAKFNLGDGAGMLQDAQFLLVAPELRGVAEAISRDQTGGIRLTRNEFTRCEPGSRTWAISASRMHVAQGEVFGTARNAVLKVQGVPVLYMPYLRFPVSDERQSGFLFPQIGFSGEQGADLEAPYYLNLAPNYDATLTPRLISKRGVGLEAEVRHLSRWQRTELFGGYLFKDDLHNGELDRKDWAQRRDLGLTEAEEFKPANRWLVGVDHSGRLGRLRTHIDYAAVSDRDYFRDVGGDLGGYNRINLMRYGALSYQRDGLLLRLWAQGFQRLDEIRSPEYERVPALDINYSGRGPGPLQFSLAVGAAVFDRNNEGFRGIHALTGERVHVEPRLVVPFHWPFGFLSVSAGYRYTAYWLESTAQPAADDAPERGIPTGAVGGGLVFERAFTAFGAAMVQTLEPRVQYLYQGYENQDGLPLFDAKALTFGYRQLFRDNRFSGIDRIGDANRLSVGVTTRLLDGDDGRERLRASLGQIFHFKDRRVTLTGPPNQDDRHQASAIAAELASQFAHRWRLSGTLAWDPADRQVDEGAINLAYQAGSRRLFNLGYRNRRLSDIDQTDLSFYWPLSRRYAAFGRWNYDLKGGRTIDGMAGLEYNNCCWRARLLFRHYVNHPAARSFEDVDQDSGVFVQLLFKGLGGLGGRVESMLERSVRGYRSLDG